MLIKKIKKSELEELGDEWTPLEADDIAETGITLAEGEILVYETPEPLESDDAELTTVRKQLRKANKESASRRILLKDIIAERDGLKTEVENLRRTDAERALKDRKEGAKQLFETYVKEKEHVFISDVAGEDVMEAVFASIDWSKDVTKEMLGPIVDKVVGKKSYVLKAVELPPTDGGKQGGPGKTAVVLDDDLLKEVAADFGMQYETPKQGEK